MKLLKHFFEVLVGDVGVDLRGRDVAVAEHGLDGPDVSSFFEESCGEAVTQGVWRYFFVESCVAGVLSHEFFDRISGESLS